MEEINKITVLMPVYNPHKDELINATNSIIQQSYKNFDFLIVDDGSNSATKNILNQYSNLDSRIHIITHHQNKGLIESLNNGLRISKTKWVARMDADDWSYPDRLEKQIRFLEKNPDVSVLGTEAIWMDNLKKIVKSNTFSHEDIVSSLPFYCCLIHPSVLLNRDNILKIGGYPQVYGAEDYALWAKICYETNLKMHILPEVCIKYRRPSIKKYGNKQNISDKKVKHYIFEALVAKTAPILAPDQKLVPQQNDSLDTIYKALNEFLPQNYNRNLLKENFYRAKAIKFKKLMQEKRISNIEFLWCYLKYKALLLFISGKI